MGDYEDASIESERRLRQAVENLYLAFGDIPKPRQISDPLLHYYSPEQEVAMRTKTLREFTPEEMDDYAWHSFYAEGQHEQATRYWLPRLLDVLCQPPALPDRDAGIGLVFDFDFILRQMAKANWQSWPLNQRQAFCRWCRAWWDAILTYPVSGDRTWCYFTSDVPASRNATYCLDTLAMAEYDVADLLARWRADDGLPAIRELVRFAECVGQGKLDGEADLLGRAARGKQPERNVVAWLLASETTRKLEKARDNIIEQALTDGRDEVILDAQQAEERITFVLQLLDCLRTVNLPPASGFDSATAPP